MNPLDVTVAIYWKLTRRSRPVMQTTSECQQLHLIALYMEVAQRCASCARGPFALHDLAREIAVQDRVLGGDTSMTSQTDTDLSTEQGLHLCLLDRSRRELLEQAGQTFDSPVYTTN